jgi:hypothetical protein
MKSRTIKLLGVRVEPSALEGAASRMSEEERQRMIRQTQLCATLDQTGHREGGFNHELTRWAAMREIDEEWVVRAGSIAADTLTLEIVRYHNDRASARADLEAWPELDRETLWDSGAVAEGSA